MRGDLERPCCPAGSLEFANKGPVQGGEGWGDSGVGVRDGPLGKLLKPLEFVHFRHEALLFCSILASLAEVAFLAPMFCFIFL